LSNCYGRPNLVEDLEVTRPEQVRVADITYIRSRKEFVYLAMLMDVFTTMKPRPLAVRPEELRAIRRALFGEQLPLAAR
jgi:transposase InsO family protein